MDIRDVQGSEALYVSQSDVFTQAATKEGVARTKKGGGGACDNINVDWRKSRWLDADSFH